MRLLTEQFSSISSGSGYVNSNSLRNSNQFSSRFTLSRHGAWFGSGDWAQVSSSRFYARDTNGWVYLTLRNINVAGFQNVGVRYSLYRFK